MIRQLQPYRAKILAVSIAIVYLWFGTLKFFPGVSPAEALAKQTLDLLTMGLVPSRITYSVLAIWEVTIGCFLLLNIWRKTIVYIAIVHILFTFTPLFLLPSLSFNEKIYSLTLVGQYIIKNFVILGALIYLFPEKPKLISSLQPR